MPVHVHKKFNAVAAVLHDGVAVSLGRNETFLHVWNAEGKEIARFRTDTVKAYWVEASPVSSLAGVVDAPA